MVIVGLIGRIFKLQSLMADVPQVTVAAVAGICGEGKVNAMSFAVFDFGLTGIQRPFVISPGGDDFDIRSQGLDAEFKTDLVVPLAGSAVADGSSAFLPGDFHQLLGDQRPCHGSAEQILVFINGVCLHAGHHVFVAEFIYNVQYVELGCAAEFGALFQTVQFFFLAAVDADTDYFIVKIFFQPRNDCRGVQSAGIGEDYFFFHIYLHLPPQATF